MATKMKLPIIVLCIFSILLTIVSILANNKSLDGLEETTSDEYVSESFSEEITEEISTNWFIPPTGMNEPTCESENNEQPDVEAEDIHSNKEIELLTNNSKNKNYENEKDILAKLLYCEAGGTSWDCQVYTCSAILNLSDHRGETISEMASQEWLFSVAPWVWGSTPTQTQYEVIDYVLSGGRVSDVKWFRTNYYHNFGSPVTTIDNVYFSM